jgi:hypothetical protein
MNRIHTTNSAKKRSICFELLVSSLLAGALSASAQSTTISLPDIGTFAGYTDGTQADTYTGTGFLGIYPDITGGNGSSGAFAHLFGLENYGSIYSETELQAPIGGLAGDTITSATLSFTMLNGAGGGENVDVTSFTTTGTLGFNNSAPNDLGSLTASGITTGLNTIDVTSLVQAAVSANQGYLGLFLTPGGPNGNLWTYTYTGFGYNANSANAQLVINYTSSVPDAASTAAMLSTSFGLLAWAKNRRKAAVR